MKTFLLIALIMITGLIFPLAVQAAPDSPGTELGARDDGGGPGGSGEDGPGKTEPAAGREKLLSAAALAGAVLLVLTAVLLRMLRKNNQALAAAQKELENSRRLMQTFIDADDTMVYLKDEHLNYILLNQAFADFYGCSPETILGRDEFALSAPEFAEGRRKQDLAALERGALVIEEIAVKGRTYTARKFPVRMPGGEYGVGAYIRDITEEHFRQRSRERMLRQNKLLLEVLGRSFGSRQEQLDYALHELLKLAESRYGCICFYDEEKEEFTLQAWAKSIPGEGGVPGRGEGPAEIGIWGEAVRQRRPLIVNAFTPPGLRKEGDLKGHPGLQKLMAVPLFIEGKIVAVAGFGNRPADYGQADAGEMTMLLSGVWNAVQRRASVETLAYERNKYRQTLLSIGDGVMVIDRDKKIEMLNAVACRLTGCSPEAAVGVNYKEVFSLSHEQEGFTIDDPIEKVFLTGEVQELGNHAILTARDGTEYNLEDSAAPIKDDKGALAGVVLVFRDVTEKKEQRKKIEYISFHDSLTGLYNRRFFEEELHRIDTGRNLPISIIMGDVNSLKLTNDIFGHAFGDMLLERVAEVMTSICRADDIIARWGGDEFIILLPRTDSAQAESIAGRIKEEVSAQQIRAIRSSISIGHATKVRMSQDIMQVLGSAETKMYSVKTLERSDVQSRELAAIINSLSANSELESRHAMRVSALCREFGRALELPESEIQKLTEAARLHDIGKIVLEPGFLKKGDNLSPSEWSEMYRHPVIGYRILNSFDHTLELAEVVLAHHENWDGSGYPKGLKGEKIPLLARIISIAGVYDRLRHDPAQAGTRSREEALREIRHYAGTQLDPGLVDAFVEMLENGRLAEPDHSV